jgi:hypothetical protein
VAGKGREVPAPHLPGTVTASGFTVACTIGTRAPYQTRAIESAIASVSSGGTTGGTSLSRVVARYNLAICMQVRWLQQQQQQQCVAVWPTLPRPRAPACLLQQTLEVATLC